MNVNDTEIIRAILLDHLKPKTDDNDNDNHTAFPSNQSFTLAEDAADADVVCTFGLVWRNPSSVVFPLPYNLVFARVGRTMSTSIVK